MEVKEYFLKLMEYNFKEQPKVVSHVIMWDLLINDTCNKLIRLGIEGKDLIPFIAEEDLNLLHLSAKSPLGEKYQEALEILNC